MTTSARHAALPRALVLTLGCSGCVLGLLLGLFLAGEIPLQATTAEPSALPAVRRPSPAPGDPPFGVLLALIDRAAAPPRLRGAWLIYTLPGAHNMYLQGLPFDLACAATGAAMTRLSDAYGQSGVDERQGDAVLRAMVQRVFPGQSVDYYMVLDAAALDEFAGWLSPVAIDNAAPGTRPSGWWFDPAGSAPTLARQEDILAGLMAALHRQRVETVAGKLYGSVQRTGRTDLGLAQFETFLDYLARYGADPAHRTFLRLDPTRHYCQP